MKKRREKRNMTNKNPLLPDAVVRLAKKYGSMADALKPEVLEKEGYTQEMSYEELMDYREKYLKQQKKEIKALRGLRITSIKSDTTKHRKENNKPKVKEREDVTKTVNVKNKDTRKLFNLYLRGKKDKELSNVISTITDGVLMPEELKHDLETAKKHHNSMRQFVDVVTVKESNGIYVTDDPSNVFQELIDFKAGNKISEQDMKFKMVSYETKRYGSITKVSEELYQDADFDMVKFFTNTHAEKATRTENKLIFNAIISNVPVKSLENGQALKMSLNKDFNSALEKEIRVFTNKDGLERLSAEGLVKNVPQPDGTLKRYIDIYPLEVFSNEQLPSDDENQSYTYKPNEGFQGKDSFSYIVTDLVNSVSANYTVTVDSNEPLVISHENLISNADIDNLNPDKLRVRIIEQPVNGQLIDNKDQTFSIPFIYGSLSREVKLFTSDRVEVLVDMKNTGFLRNIVFIRGIEDYDVKVLPNPTQVIYGEIPLD